MRKEHGVEAQFMVHSLCSTNYAEVTVGPQYAAYYIPCEDEDLILPNERLPKATNICLRCIDGQELFWEIFRDYHPVLLSLKRSESMVGPFWVYAADLSDRVWENACLALRGASGDIPSLVELNRRQLLPLPEDVTLRHLIGALRKGFPLSGTSSELLEFIARKLA